jgi:ribose transport system permease protein
MSQPQAQTPAPEKPDGAAGGVAAPGVFGVARAQLTGRARGGGIVYPFIVLFVILAIWKGATFYGKTNLLEILDQQSATLIIAAAGTMVLVAGGIDLSVGATYALAQVIATKMALTGNPVLAIIVGVLVGVGVGAVNGVIATFFRINSLIATLAMSFVIGGLAALVTNGNLIIAYTALGFANFARTQFLGVSTAAWTMIGVIVILGIVLSRTIGGRYMYAAGSNAEAARLAGVRVQWIKLLTFAISGGAAALGGILDASRVLSASSANGGTALTFTVLAGIVVGGTSILGGDGAIWRTVVGTLFIALIGNGFTLLAWNPLYEQITLGVILLLAVGGDAWSRLRTTG